VADERIPEAMGRVADLAQALGVSHINRLPGCWEHAFGAYRLAVNGHREPKAPTFAPDFQVDPYHAYVERDGLPLAILSPGGGTVVGGGTEDALIDALDAEIARVGGGAP
jgi:hypothetical protein